MVLGEQVLVAQEVPVDMVQEVLDTVLVDMVVEHREVVAKWVDLVHRAMDRLEVGMQHFHHKIDCIVGRL